MSKVVLIFFLLFFSHNNLLTTPLNSFQNYDTTDIAKTFLNLEKETKPAIDVEKYLFKIDSLTKQITFELKNCATIQDIGILNDL